MSPDEREFDPPPTAAQALAELAAALQAAGPAAEQLAGCLTPLAALSGRAGVALYLRAESGELERRARLGEGVPFPQQLPLPPPWPALAPSAGPTLRAIAREDAGERPLAEALAAPGDPPALLLAFGGPGPAAGLCLFAGAGATALAGPAAASLVQAGALLGFWQEAQRLRAEARVVRQRFQDLSLSSADHIWELDAQGRYCYNSDGVRLLLGYRPVEMSGRRPLDFVHPEDRGRLRRVMAQARTRREPLSELVHRALGADGDEIYVESRAIPILGTAGELLGYRGVDRNITDWFQAKRVLEETITGTCEALSRMVELRDPYTKGHSVRVATLAVFLARRLGRSPYELRGLQLMGLLHDIGKVGIPTEILSKPGRLGPEELELMRQHPQMGYEILRDISFPWPVAAAVLQHHERLDGSGYPQGLTGNEQMWQVRVLAVADLLEAMATDRPYRPGLGPDLALKELRQQRGQLYDAEVVDAVLAAAATGELAELLAASPPVGPAEREGLAREAVHARPAPAREPLPAR